MRGRGGFNDAIMCVSNGGTNAAIEVDMSPTLTAHDAKSTSYVFSGQNSAKAGLSLDKETCPTLSTTKKPQVMLGDLVRRLTPMEFERLQGFPDGWTDIPYRGKRHAPDSARYRALGNSMAVPVMMWLGQAVEQADQGMTGADDAFHSLMERLPASEKDEGSVDTTPGKGRWMRAGACRNGGYVMGSVPDWTNSPKTLPLCEILEDPATIPAKYRLSARACKGILTRARDRGKAMDPVLEETLNRQIADQTAD